MFQSRLIKTFALVTASALALTACSSGSTAGSQSASTPSAASVTIEDNNATITINTPVESVVSTDNRTFETLSDWGVKLKAAPVALMPDTIAYKTDSSIVDLGTHREPNLEALVAANPDVIINGQRFTQFYDKIVQLVPNAKVISLDPRDDKPFDEELKRQVSVLGEVFSKQTEAKQLTDDFDAALARVKAAYQPEQSVLALNVSGGEIGYLAPAVGRTLGPVFEFAGLTPALQVEGASDDHQGDDISVEAIAKSNPDWILVMDRDAAISNKDANYQPAAEIIEGTEALQAVTAIKNKHVVYMPADTYTNEGIQTYTEFLNSFADALEGKS